MITSPCFGSLNFGKRKKGMLTPISVYGTPIQSGVRIPYTNRLPIKKSPIIMVFSILPVGTMYASINVTFNKKATRIIMNSERVSCSTLFLFMVKISH